MIATGINSETGVPSSPGWAADVLGGVGGSRFTILPDCWQSSGWADCLRNGSPLFPIARLLDSLTQ